MIGWLAMPPKLLLFLVVMELAKNAVLLMAAMCIIRCLQALLCLYAWPRFEFSSLQEAQVYLDHCRRTGRKPWRTFGK